MSSSRVCGSKGPSGPSVGALGGLQGARFLEPNRLAARRHTACLRGRVQRPDPFAGCTQDVGAGQDRSLS